MFGSLFSNPVKKLLAQQAAIVDIRTVHEYDQGRIRGSINIPLDRIPASIERIADLQKPVIVVGSGDGRSGNATRFLRKNRISPIADGGNWERVWKIMQRS